MGDAWKFCGVLEAIASASRFNVNVALVLSLIIIITSIIIIKRTSSVDESKRGKFPRGPAGWPLLGNLPLLIGKPFHQAVAELSYGPIVGLRLGSRPAVVVSSPELAKEVLLTHDKIFANRPRYRLADHLFFGYNNSVIFSTYSPRWAWLRKVYSLELLTAKRLNQLQHIRQDEVRRLLQALMPQGAATSGQAVVVDLEKHLAEMSANTTARLLHSATLAETAPDLPEVVTGLETIGKPTLGDFIPCLSFLDLLHICRMWTARNRFGQIIDSMILKRRQAMVTTPPQELPHDFLQVILSKEAAEDPQERLTNQEIKSIISDILQGAIHTSTATIEWAIAELIGSPTCMEKLHKEVDEVMQGKGPAEQLVTDEDVGKLPYLQNVVKEVLRLHPVVPMLVPRISSKECKIGEYTLPKGTHAFVNVWAIARDPLLWGDKSEQFIPERFEDESKVEVELRGQHYELLPFGSGRRVCPGMRLGLSVVQVTIANLVKTFDWELPPGSGATLDMSANGVGIVDSKATPLLAVPKPRPATR